MQINRKVLVLGKRWRVSSSFLWSGSSKISNLLTILKSRSVFENQHSQQVGLHDSIAWAIVYLDHLLNQYASA